jgi:hypothetical protein
MNKNLPLIIIDHLSQGHKPNFEIHWNFYLTGLIQGCGEVYLNTDYHKWIYNININIFFENNDIVLVHTLRQKIGYGKIKKSQELKKISYFVDDPKGILKIYELTKNKLVGLNLLNTSIKFKTPSWSLIRQDNEIKLGYKNNSEMYQVLKLQYEEINHVNHNLNSILPKKVQIVHKSSSTGIYKSFSHVSHYWLSGFLDANLGKKHIKLNFKSQNTNINCISETYLRSLNLSSTYLVCQIRFELNIINKSYLTLTLLKELFGLSLTNINYLFSPINIKIRNIEINRRIYLYHFNTCVSKMSYYKLDFKDLPSQISARFKQINFGSEIMDNPQLNICQDLNNLLNKYMSTKPGLYPRFTSSFILYFPNAKLSKLIQHLDNCPLLSYKFTKCLKLRKIYRICQRKEILHQNGVLKILSLWNTLY